MQAGSLGLLDAIDDRNTKRGAEFRAYARKTIRHKITTANEKMAKLGQQHRETAFAEILPIPGT